MLSILIITVKKFGMDFKETEEKKWRINTNVFIMVLVKGLM